MKLHQKNILLSICAVFILLGLNSCGVSKFIPEGESLYTGATLETILGDSLKSIENRDELEDELNALIRPEPNSQVLGTRFGLYYHYKAQKEKPGFINRWLNKKFGEEPVYFSEVNQQRVSDLLRNRLDNRGFLYSTVSTEIDSSRKFAAISYTATLPQPYVLENFAMDSDSLTIYKEINELLPETVLKKGNRFDLQALKLERERIDFALKQKGYYNFNSDFLIFEADTNQYKNKKFDLYLRLKKETPAKAIVPYTINSISVYPNYTISNDSLQIEPTTINNLKFIQEEEYFKPKKLEPYILFDNGQLYNPQTAKITSNRLASLGSYKFVNIRFNEADSLEMKRDTAALDANIFLSPLNRRALRAELQTVTKSNGFAGPGIVVSYSNRNMFKGGETLSLSANFAYESQISGNSKGLSSIVGGLKADLIIPRLIPYSPSRFKYSVPKTKISLGTDFLKRSQLFTLTSWNTTFGYNWKANSYVYHELNPIDINYVNLSKTTPDFEEILDNNPYLRQSFEQQFIAGLNYNFTYNELVDESKSTPIFLSTNLGFAGNLLNLISGSKNTIFGLEYAQYAKLDIDFRYYFKWGREQTLVTRIFSGWGIPYGNSSTLPFVKQFYAGGPYSVRAFQIRSLGPGTFTSDGGGTNSFYDQSGNLRLEANLEYRFPIWSYLKGALFADAGNVWLTYEPEVTGDETIDGVAFNERLQTEGKFEKDWYKELGIGVGFGLRLDIQSFVIRLDLASPWQIPYLPEEERIRTPFFDGGDNNLVFNFAIGYPF